MNIQPPRLAERLLGWLLPRPETEFVVGDLAEQFHDDVAERRTGARLRYWKEAMVAVWQAARATLVANPPETEW